jgi:hypothetical protein
MKQPHKLRTTGAEFPVVRQAGILHSSNKYIAPVTESLQENNPSSGWVRPGARPHPECLMAALDCFCCNR